MKHLPNIICAIGLTAFGYGLWSVYPPLAWIAGGLFVCFAGVLALRKT